MAVLFADRPPEELGEFTGFLMSYLGRRSAAQFASLLAPHGLHPRDFGVLVVIGKRPGMTQQQLAEVSSIDRSSMVALLDELEARGLAERRPHPEDRRKRSIYLTSKGAATVEDLRLEARRSGEAFFGRLSAEERATLHRLLRKLAALD
ncbi:MAG: MarR family transcriptional regulator [Actinobacteria bacterium]|nr:MAG: MarR family transcriptional regulator [Actinomycetota bacterium]